MLVYDLDGNQTKWKLNGKEITLDNRPRSSLHKSAREIIKEKFPTFQVLEEVSIKVYKNKVLHLDFYLPLKKLAIEVHGKQHYEFNTMFHSTPKDFLIQKRNDTNKEEWCQINGINLIIFPYNESISIWKDKL